MLFFLFMQKSIIYQSIATHFYDMGEYVII